MYHHVHLVEVVKDQCHISARVCLHNYNCTWGSGSGGVFLALASRVITYLLALLDHVMSVDLRIEYDFNTIDEVTVKVNFIYRVLYCDYFLILQDWVINLDSSFQIQNSWVRIIGKDHKILQLLLYAPKKRPLYYFLTLLMAVAIWGIFAKLLPLIRFITYLQHWSIAWL